MPKNKRPGDSSPGLDLIQRCSVSAFYPNCRTVAAGTIPVLVQQHTQRQRVRGVTRPLILPSPPAPAQNPTVGACPERAQASRRVVEHTLMKTLTLAAGILAASAGAPLAAHHSFAAEFDASKAIRLNGTLTKVEWTNP